MNWTELKLHDEWTVHLAKNDKGESNGKYIIRHLNCPDGAVLPVLDPRITVPQECTECGEKVPEGIIKRLPFIINRDKLIT